MSAAWVTGTVMWEGTVRGRPYVDQIEATVAANFDALGLTPSAYRGAAEQVGGLTTVKRLADAAGLTLHLDTVTGWAPLRYPSDADAALKLRFDHQVDSCLELVDALGLVSVLAVGAFDIGAVPHDTLVAGFADLCDRCDQRGVEVMLEFMPFWGVPDLAAAWSIVRAVQRPNASIMLDTWHFAHSGRDVELLRSIDPAVALHLQLSDGPQADPAGDLVAATLHSRTPPGRGDLDVAEMVAIVRERGVPATAGPEVFSDDLDALPADEVGRIVGPAVRVALGADV